MFPFTKLLAANYNATAKIVVDQGGTSSGKTFSILQTLLAKALSKRYTISVVSESVPHLKKGVIRDIENIIIKNEWINRFLLYNSFEQSYNKSERILYFKNGSKIEFTSFETEQSARGGRRDFLFINECNAISYNIYWQLQFRTGIQTFLDYNPSSKFWVHDKVLHQDGVQLIISDHRGNPYIDQYLHDQIEAIGDEEQFKVYGRGMTGQVKGLVFTNWRVVDKFPEHCTKWVYGMDFGYSNSYTTLVKVGEFGGELYIEELVYERGLQNEDILIFFKTLGISTTELIMCDSNEPKTRDWLYGKGYNIQKTIKGGDTNPDVNYGISMMKSYRINVTSDSSNAKKEFEKYAWKLDKNGESLNEPVKLFDHAIDAARYGFVEILADTGFYVK